MEQALSGLNCHVIPSTSDEAPSLLAYVAPHLGAHHSPDLFHVQHALSKAVSAPMGAKQRAADKAMTTAEEQLTRVQEHAQNDRAQPARRGPGRIRIKLSIDSFRKHDGFVVLTYTLLQYLRGGPSFSRGLGRQTFGGGTDVGEKAA